MAYVEMDSVEGVQAALQMTGQAIMGTPILVQRSLVQGAALVPHAVAEAPPARSETTRSEQDTRRPASVGAREESARPCAPRE